MLYRIKRFYGNRLETTEGQRVGHVADCYFDDRTWTVLFFAVDTYWWTPLRRVLISPHVLKAVPQHGRVLPVNLTRKQIEDGPTLEVNETVTAAHVSECFRHYNWPFYWLGGTTWGPSDSGAEPARQANRRAKGEQPNVVTADLHLRSARSFFGFPVQAGPDCIGQVDDLLVDGKQWQIRDLAVDLSHHWLPPKSILVSTRRTLPIDWEEERVHITTSKAQIESTLGPHEAVHA
jgi:uncharacterized protein YrrD